MSFHLMNWMLFHTVSEKIVSWLLVLHMYYDY